MKKYLAVVFAVFCVIAFCVAPASASTGLVAKSTGMTVSPIIGDIIWPKSSNTGTVSQGTSEMFSYTIPSGSTELVVRVAWSSASNNLGLNVMLPDSSTFGEFDDYTDGSANGAISIQFKDTAGLQWGTWKFQVNGKSVSGSQSFTLTVVSS